MSKADVKFPSAPDTSAIDIQDEGSVIVSNPTALNFTGPGVTVTENPSGTAEVDIPGLQYWTESEDATTQQSTIFTPNNSATNVNAVLLPKGNGANTAQTPDGTTTGGNARGQYATDWQKRRTNANQVASGNDSTISGGRNNTASGTDSTVSGGRNNVASGADSAIIGGQNQNATGSKAIAGGLSNTSSSTGSTAFGTNCTASAERAFAAGSGCIASGFASRATGNSSAIAGYTSADGRGKSYLIGQRSNSGTIGPFYQYFDINAASTDDLSSADTTFLGLQGGEGAGKSNSDIGLSDNTFWKIKCMWIAVVENITGTATGVNIGDFMVQVDFFGCKKVGASAPVLTSTTTTATNGDVAITGTATLIHSIVSGSLTPTFTAPIFSGGGTLTMRVHAQYEIVEITFT